MWLAFDDIKTPDGWMPLVAMVDDVPGIHSVRVNYNREGEIEASTTKRQEAMQAAAEGALGRGSTGSDLQERKGRGHGSGGGSSGGLHGRGGPGAGSDARKKH